MENFLRGKIQVSFQTKQHFWEETYWLADLAMRNVIPFFAEWNAT